MEIWMTDYIVKYAAWDGTIAYAATRIEMETLDLHRLSYQDAHREVERFVNHNWDAPEGSLTIITGHSKEMRKVAIVVLDRYGVAYTIGGPIGIDESYILI